MGGVARGEGLEFGGGDVGVGVFSVHGEGVFWVGEIGSGCEDAWRSGCMLRVPGLV